MNTLEEKIRDRKRALTAEIKEGRAYLRNFKCYMAKSFQKQTYQRLQRRIAARQELINLTRKAS